jgi:hypothetical protein
MKPEEFELRLSRQPLRQIPPAWRVEILSAARDAQAAHHASRITHQSWLSTLNHQLSTLLWPHPKAWAGLAAVWVCILVLSLSTHDASPKLTAKSAPPSPEVIVQLKKQQKLYTELVGLNESREADRPKDAPPRPRTQRGEIMVA